MEPVEWVAGAAVAAEAVGAAAGTAAVATEGAALAGEAATAGAETAAAAAPEVATDESMLQKVRASLFPSSSSPQPMEQQKDPKDQEIETLQGENYNLKEQIAELQAIIEGQKNAA